MLRAVRNGGTTRVRPRPVILILQEKHYLCSGTCCARHLHDLSLEDGVSILVKSKDQADQRGAYALRGDIGIMEIQPEDQSESRNSAPGIAIALNIVGTLDILGGVILFFSFLPGHADPGYTWGTYAYVASITALFGGIVSGLLMFAAASALTYLHGIHKVSTAVVEELYRVSSSIQGRNLETTSTPSEIGRASCRERV